MGAIMSARQPQVHFEVDVPIPATASVLNVVRGCLQIEGASEGMTKDEVALVESIRDRTAESIGHVEDVAELFGIEVDGGGAGCFTLVCDAAHSSRVAEYAGHVIADLLDWQGSNQTVKFSWGDFDRGGSVFVARNVTVMSSEDEWFRAVERDYRRYGPQSAQAWESEAYNDPLEGRHQAPSAEDGDGPAP